MNLIYGTKNPAKVAAMKRRLSTIHVPIQGLLELGQEIPEIPETGNSPLENARQKAFAYYQIFHQPVFSCDSGLYLEQVPEELQPGVHVRTIQGRSLTDDEMIAYYSGLAKKYGDLKARYHNAICLVVDETHSYEAMDESMASKPFLMTSIPHARRKEGFPLDSLSIEISSGRYYYDIEKKELDEVAVEDGFLSYQLIMKQ